MTMPRFKRSRYIPVTTSRADAIARDIARQKNAEFLAKKAKAEQEGEPTLPSHRCIKPQCPPTCADCCHALPPTDKPRNLVASLLNEFAVCSYGITFEAGDHPLVDQARAYLISHD